MTSQAVNTLKRVLLAAMVLTALVVALRYHRGPLTFRSTSTMEPKFTSLFWKYGPLVDGINASPAPRDAFPASFWANEHCSATLIGPSVLVSAKHCFDGLTTAEVELDGKRYQGDCTIADTWSGGRLTADVALCSMDVPLPVRQFETVSFDAARIQRGTKVMLTGFGGSRSLGLGMGSYVTGMTEVQSVTDGIMTTSDEAFTQPGDSGGGGFTESSGRRVLISVNSKVDRKLHTSRAQLLASSREFVEGWAKQAQLSFCRDGAPPTIGQTCR
jgi:trypsin